MDVFEPRSYRFKGVPARNIINQNAADRASIVGPRDGLESFLACRVPHLQLNVDAFVHGDDSRRELNADSHVVTLGEVALGKAEENARLSDSRVAYNDKLKCVSVLICLHYFL